MAVTIQAPGIEINEIDLSFYDFPGPKEDTTNVLVTGFAPKGLNYVPHKFTSKNTTQDLIDTFGVPNNEAERYFFNACNEVISREKTVLFASRLPYCNHAISTMNGAEYVISSMADISADYRTWFGFVRGKVGSPEEISQVEYDADGASSIVNLPIDIFGFVPNRKSFFNTDFTAIENFTSATVSASDNDGFLSTLTELMVDTSIFEVSCSGYNQTLTDGWVISTTNDSNNCPCFEDAAAVELSNIGKYKYEFKTDEAISLVDLSIYIDELSGNAEFARQYSSQLAKWKKYLEDVRGKPLSAGSDSITCTCDCCDITCDCKQSGENNDVYPNPQLYVTPCYYRVKYGGAWGDAFGEIYTEDKTVVNAAKIEFKETKQYKLDTVEQYRTGERKPALNRFIILDKTQAEYEEVPVDQYHKGNNQQIIGIVPVVTTAANALYYQKMIDVDEDDAEQLANYEAMGDIITMKNDTDVLKGKTNFQTDTGCENAFLYAENIVNQFTNEVEPKLYNNLLVTGTNSKYYAPDNKNADTMSKIATSMFPWIGKNNVGEFDREYLKHIGVVVFKGYLDSEEGNKVNYKPIESFAGTLKPGVLNSVTGKSMFIDDIINTNSQYIEFYSNCFNADDNNFYTWDPAVQFEDAKTQQLSADTKQSLVFRSINPNLSAAEMDVETPEQEISASTYDKSTYDCFPLNDVDDPTNNGTHTRPGQVNGVIWDDVDILIAQRMNAPVFGFKKYECLKIINVSESITKALDKCFSKIKNINAAPLDLVVDAGVSNIAQYYTTCNCPSGIFYMDSEDPDRGWYSILEAGKTRFTGKMFKRAYKVALNYNPVSPTAVKNWKLSDAAHTKRWQLVLRKLDDFCKNIRKDCMFIADGLRPLCLKGNAKLVRPSNYKNTISNTIAPLMKYIAGAVDTSYGAGYCDWVQKEDEFTGLNFWLPPSIKALGAYIDSRNNGHYWDAPAGINRGKIDVKDIAFNPTVEEAAAMYTKSWNYCTWYHDEGHVIEGQKTFQSRPTAFDRVNVRLLFLYLEKKVYHAARYFLYKGNTAYTRQRLVDTITPYFENAKIQGGLYDYRIQCDDKNNTADTIDRNELHVKIGIKPVKSIEFIDCTFIALRTGGSWSEAGF